MAGREGSVGRDWALEGSLGIDVKHMMCEEVESQRPTFHLQSSRLLSLESHDLVG